jgi:hypothetical protein
VGRTGVDVVIVVLPDAGAGVVALFVLLLLALVEE